MTPAPDINKLGQIKGNKLEQIQGPDGAAKDDGIE